MNHPSTRQRVGLALAGLLSVTTIPSILMPAREGQTGPPLRCPAALHRRRRDRGRCRRARLAGSCPRTQVAAGAVIIPTLTALPAFFVDVPAEVRLLVATSVAVAAIVLMFSTERRSVPVLD